MSPTPERRPVGPDDLFRLAILQGARLSPDGRRAAYAVATVGPDETQRAALWLIALETGEQRQLTAGLAVDSDPEWSPDGRQVAFRSTRDGEKPQLYVIPVDGGEARQLTRLGQGVGGGPRWSPDGRTLAFTAAAAPPPDRSKPYRLSRHVYRFDAIGYLDGALQAVYLVDAAGGEPRRLTDDEQSYTLQAWSPDGAELLALCAMRPDSHNAYYAGLVALTPAGERRELTGGWGHASAAAWTPDGARVAFFGAPRDRKMGAKADLWVIDRAGGAPECRTAALRFHIGGSLQDDMDTAALASPALRVAADGRSAYAQVQVGGTMQVYRVALHGPEECAAVLSGERSCILFGAGERELLFGVSTLHNPLDLYASDLAGGAERRLTQLNADVTETWAPVTVEPLAFHGRDGEPVEGWLIHPPAGERPYPTVLYIHGGPHSGFGHIFSFDFQLLAGAGYAVLIVNQRGSTGYGDAFATQIVGDWGNHDYHDLIAGVDAAVARGLADPNRLGVCGLSGGGNLSCWIVGQTGRFKAAVPENPVTNWVSFYGVSDIGPWFAVEELGGRPHEIPEVYQRCSPITYAHRCTTPTLLIQAELDYRCPAEQSEQFYAVLKASGCPVEMLRLPGGAHAAAIMGAPALRTAQNAALLDWMNRYVLQIATEPASPALG